MEFNDTETKRLFQDLADIRLLIPLAPILVGTATPGQRATTRAVPGPKPPISLESLTLADTTINPVKVQETNDLDAKNDPPAKILNTWWTFIVDHITPEYPLHLTGATDHDLTQPGTVACLLDVNTPAFLATGNPEIRCYAWDLRVLAARLRHAAGEHIPNPEPCPTCGKKTLHADSDTSRVVTCAACGWQRTAPILLTLDQIADVYDSNGGDDWTPTLRTLHLWRSKGLIEPHTGLLSASGENLFRLEQINEIVRKKTLNGWKKREEKS